MLKRSVWIAGVASAAVGLATFAAVSGGASGAGEPERADCPGKIVCPVTGELVCKDQCPLIDPNRPDCPGRIVCELTGELVCKDRCPLNESDEPKVESKPPACCRGDG
ncbi:MAG: hypothetical protein IH985_06840 [Planctomycetes bacterium]|nr:hypothetical protein [Planctomycetota bacterium]